MHVRRARAADATAIVAILEPEIVAGVAHFGTVVPTAADVAADIAATAPHVYLVAEREGQIAGFAKSSPWKTRAAYAWTAELGIYLHADHRGQGVGKALVTALVDELESRGFRSLIAGIALPNPASVALFERLGFTPVGVFRRQGFKHGRWHDVGYWERHLGEGAPGPSP